MSSNIVSFMLLFFVEHVSLFQAFSFDLALELSFTKDKKTVFPRNDSVYDDLW